MSSVCFPKEVERNLQDAMQVCRNVLLDPQLVPGGGASEMAVAHALTEKSKAMTGVEQWPYRAVAQALEVLPRTLIQNCGASTIRLLTSLRVSSFPRFAPDGVGRAAWPRGWFPSVRLALLTACAFRCPLSLRTLDVFAVIVITLSHVTVLALLPRVPAHLFLVFSLELLILLLTPGQAHPGEL